MKMSYWLILMLAMCVSVPLLAQKPHRVNAEYTYTSDNMDESPNQACQKAFLYARQDALKKVFGERVDGETEYIASIENGTESVSFRQRGGTMIRADWLKTVKEEVRSRSMTNDGFMIFTVYVEGMAREITTAGITLEYHILRNDTKLQNEDRHFKNLDNLYLWFKAPTDGYLTVYTTDEQKAYCMLPYQEQTDGVYQINANHEYIFYSKEHALKEEKNFGMPLVLSIDKDYEVNDFYIVFSKNLFTKVPDNAGSSIGEDMNLIRNVDLKKFNDWLYECQKRDVLMQVERTTITISK